MRQPILIIILFFTVSYAYSQERYLGEYKFNGLTGKGDFLYELGEGNRAILVGDFKFSRKFIDSLDKRRLFKLDVEGEYKENLKINSWRYRDQNHEISLEDVNNFVPSINLKSTSIRVDAFYNEGIPHGEWKIEENKFENEDLRLSFDSEKLRFKNGKIVGGFQFTEYENQNNTYIKGQTTDNGLMNGNWEFFYNEEGNRIKETRRYESGFLIGINKINIETEESIQEVIYYNTINKLQAIEGDDSPNYKISEKLFNLTFNDGFRDLSNEFRGQSTGNKLLEKYLKKVLKYDTLFINKENNLVTYPMHTKRFEYEISDDDFELINSLEKDFNKLENTINTFANRNSLALNKSKSDSLAFIYEFFQFNQFKVTQLKDIISIFTSDDINYIDLNNFSRDGFSFLTAVDLISYTIDDQEESKELLYSSLIERNNNILLLFQEYINEMQDYANTLGDYASSQLSRYEQTEELEVLEADILSKKTKLDEKYNSFRSESAQIQSGINNVKSNILGNNFNSLNESYSESESFNDRVDIGNNILRLLDIADFVLDSLPETYPAYEELRDFYTDVTLDPFSFESNFKVLRKRRLVEAGEKVFDHYLDRIISENDYSKIEGYFIEINNLLFRLRELRTENTNRLERRINAQMEVEQIKKLLEL